MQKGEFKHTIRQDLKDIYQFYLNQEARDRLTHMSRLRRWLSLLIWLFKSLLYKLAPVRRILLIISLVLFFSFNITFTVGHFRIDPGLKGFGFIILLLVLMLELKDKLLAHNELEAGRAVQFALMPKKNPELKGWDIWLFTRPAREVGGDLVDYLKFPDNRLGIALGDVAGKGLGAALFMAKLQATIRAIAPQFRSLTKLGKHLNAIFCRDGLPERFISLVYFELKPDNGTIHILNAGHLPPLIVQNKTVKEIDHGTAALGLKKNITFQDQCIELKPEDVFVVYSDGITEARNAEDEFFGERRLWEFLKVTEYLSVKEMGQHIIQEVDRFIGDAKISDDLSLIILKRLKS
ncbi:serine/threonine-protein phosphatase [bacterium]|nr:serine/threonine-protein phosphatase [bacterium]RQV93790.1 MAG: serine/threonine-protein phosphatase [bacterium]